MILATLLPFSAYMHRSKIAARGIELHTFGDYLAYYHADILPLLLLCLLLAAAQSIRKYSLLILAPFYYLAVFDWASWHTQGNTFFFSDIYRAAQLIIYYPEFLEKISIAFKVKTLALFLLPAIIAIAFSLKPIQRLGVYLITSMRSFIIGITMLYLLITLFVFNQQYTNYNAITFLAHEQIRTLQLNELTIDPQQMATKFGHRSTPDDNTRTQSPSAHSGFNVILFVMETIPYSLYPSFDSLITGSKNSWLKDNAVIFNNHHTTHPESDRSNYSILSGKYPPMWKTRQWKSDMQYGDSLPNILAMNNYDNYLLVTAPLSFNDDYEMYKNLGFEYMEDIPFVKNLLVKTKDKQTMDRTGLYPADENLIARSESIIEEHAKKKTSPFIMNIAPQSSHAPFHCPPDSEEIHFACANDQEKIIANAKWQFNLIKRITNALISNGLIDNTIIIITGDHGIRSKQETDLFDSASILQESTFKVPLLIAASNLDYLERTYDHPTSHIDIAPTILKLTGTNHSTDFHGVDLFTPQNRSLYLLGEGYLPVNGLLNDGQYFMKNRSSGAIYASTNLDFTAKQRRHLESSEQQQVEDELLQLEAFLNQIYSTEPESRIK